MWCKINETKLKWQIQTNRLKNKVCSRNEKNNIFISTRSEEPQKRLGRIVLITFLL